MQIEWPCLWFNSWLLRLYFSSFTSFYFKHGLKTVFQKNSPKNTSLIRQLFFEEMDSFNIATISEFENKIFFSHAPILKEWVKRIKETDNIERLVDKLNLSLVHVESKRFHLLRNRYRISYFRGGSHKCGSPIWSDVREISENNDVFLSGIDYNVFGHTQLSETIVMNIYACLDTRNAYIIAEKGEIKAV